MKRKTTQVVKKILNQKAFGRSRYITSHQRTQKKKKKPQLAQERGGGEQFRQTIQPSMWQKMTTKSTKGWRGKKKFGGAIRLLSKVRNREGGDSKNTYRREVKKSRINDTHWGPIS